MSAVVGNSTELPLAAQLLPSFAIQAQQSLLAAITGWSTWQYLVTAVIGIVTYDQSEYTAFRQFITHV